MLHWKSPWQWHGSAADDFAANPGEEWNEASAPRPTAVMMAAGTARFIATRFLELEAFVVDVGRGDAEHLQAPAHCADQRGRTAHEAVARTDVGNTAL